MRGVTRQGGPTRRGHSRRGQGRRRGCLVRRRQCGLMKIRCGNASCSQSLLACVEWTRCKGVMSDGLQGDNCLDCLSPQEWRRPAPPVHERAFPFLNIFRHGGDFIGLAPCRAVALEKISILPLGVLSGYFCGSARKSAKAILGCVTGLNTRRDSFSMNSSSVGNSGKRSSPKFIQAPFHPVFFVASFGEGFADAESLGEVGADAIIGFALARRLDQFGLQNHLVAVLPAVFDAPGFELRAGGQDDVGKRAVGVRKLSCTTMNSTLDSSRRISAERLTSACWLMRQFVATA